MKTVQEVLTLSKKYLENESIPNARFSAETIIAYVLGIKRIDLYLDFNRPLTLEELDKIKEGVTRRKTKEPLEYILGDVEFFNSTLTLTKDVLIPRPETEELVDLFIKSVKNDFKGPFISENKSFQKEHLVDLKKTLWDVGTGSGCIAISIKRAFSSFTVRASDISSAAICLAKENGIKNNCSIDFKIGDFLSPFRGEKADFIICNPPYISEKEYDDLMDDVKYFEPKNSLIAADNGLFFYKKFADSGFEYLNPGAKVVFEIGYNQKDLLYDMFADRKWISKKAYKDLSGKDRFFFLEIE